MDQACLFLLFFFPIFEWRYSQKSYYGLKNRWINIVWNRSSVAIAFPLLEEKDKTQITTESQLIGDSEISLTLCVINHLPYKQVHSAQDHLNLHFICRKPIKNENLFWANLVLVCLVLWFFFFSYINGSSYTSLHFCVGFLKCKRFSVAINCISHVRMWIAYIYEHSLTLGNTCWLLKSGSSQFYYIHFPFVCILFYVNLVSRSSLN